MAMLSTTKFLLAHSHHPTPSIPSLPLYSGTLSPIDLYPKLLNFQPVIRDSLPMSIFRKCLRPLIVTRYVCEFVCLLVCLFVYTYVCMYVCLFVSLTVWTLRQKKQKWFKILTIKFPIFLFISLMSPHNWTFLEDRTKCWYPLNSSRGTTWVWCATTANSCWISCPLCRTVCAASSQGASSLSYHIPVDAVTAFQSIQFYFVVHRFVQSSFSLLIRTLSEACRWPTRMKYLDHGLHMWIILS